jgi:hypothetical protein
MIKFILLGVWLLAVVLKLMGFLDGFKWQDIFLFTLVAGLITLVARIGGLLLFLGVVVGGLWLACRGLGWC